MTPYRFLDADWFWYAGVFPSQSAARYAWEQLDRTYARKGLDLGVYRHGSSLDPGRRVTAVSLRQEGVLRARRDLRSLGAKDVSLDELGPAELEALFARRIRFVHEQLQRALVSGHATIRRQGPGATLHRDGTMDE
jgi:hypothetical protein